MRDMPPHVTTLTPSHGTRFGLTARENLSHGVVCARAYGLNFMPDKQNGKRITSLEPRVEDELLPCLFWTELNRFFALTRMRGVRLEVFRFHMTVVNVSLIEK